MNSEVDIRFWTGVRPHSFRGTNEKERRGRCELDRVRQATVNDSEDLGMRPAIARARSN